MKYNKYSLILGVAISLLAVTSCKKYLDRTPIDAITSEAFFTNATEVEQALTGVYNAFGARAISPGYNNPTPYYSKMDLYTEIGLERGLNGTIGSGAYTTTNGTTQELWGGFYVVVQRANSLLFNMQRAKAVMSAADYSRVEAEAKTLRALAYWHLVTYFGDVLLFTGPLTAEQFASPTRTSKKAIVDFLVTDLKAAAPALGWLPTQQGRVSRGVTLGAAARLAMLDKRYTEAATITDEIIASGSYSLNPVFENIFRKAGQNSNVGNEIMFIYPYGDADAGSFNYLNLVQGSRNQGGQSSHFPSQFLVDLFECRDGLNIAQSPLYNPAQPNQNRDPRMAATVIIPGDTVFVQGLANGMVFSFANQFVFNINPATRVITYSSTTNQDSLNPFGPRQNGGGNLWRKYTNDRDVNGTAGNLYRVGWVYMRYAEILLINAEAKLEAGGNANDVVVNVNRVRNRGRMPNVSPAVLANANALKQLVRREKTVEFANEGIHMADMRRWDDGAYAAKVMSAQIYGQPSARMNLVHGAGLQFSVPAPPPTFDAQLLIPIAWPNAEALRLKRELRIFNNNQHILCPIPQVDIDRSNNSIVQNPGW